MGARCRRRRARARAPRAEALNLNAGDRDAGVGGSERVLEPFKLRFVHCVMVLSMMQFVVYPYGADGTS